MANRMILLLQALLAIFRRHLQTWHASIAAAAAVIESNTDAMKRRRSDLMKTCARPPARDFFTQRFQNNRSDAPEKLRTESALLLFLVKNAIPLSVLDDPTWQDFCREAGVKFRSQSTFRQMLLPNLATLVKSEVIQSLSVVR